MQIALLTLMTLLPFGHAHHADTAQAKMPAARVSTGAWALRARQDAFTGQTTCRLERGHAVWQRDAVAFHLGDRVDTSRAVYRIDGGAPVTAAADQPALASMGFAIWRDDLTNPSAGVVRIPAAKLANARLVMVEARTRSGRIYSFPVDGLSAAVQAAKARGCS